MYQALVRLPSHPDAESGHEPRRTGFDWGIFPRLLLRLLRGTSRPPRP
jgi:hypothetical protein